MARHRLTLSISPELKHALDELNDATGVAAASFVGGILEGQAQTFLSIAQAIRKANAEPARDAGRCPEGEPGGRPICSTAPDS